MPVPIGFPGPPLVPPGRHQPQTFKWQGGAPKGPSRVQEYSTALELSGYGTFTGVDPSSFINSVTVTLGQFASSALMGPPTVELWDYSGTPFLIGSAVGTASTSSANVDSLVFNNVTYGQLGTLRVRVIAHQGTAIKGAIQNVNYAGLTVNFSPVLGQATLATGAGHALNATVVTVDGRNPGRAAPVQAVAAPPAAYATFT